MNSSKAEFWLCLSRAFLAPMTDAAQTALRECLADDLQELAHTLGYPVAGHIADFRRAIQTLPDGEAALVLYSRLFLIPGSSHPHINTGVYFDGSVNGDSIRKLAECYLACGLEKSESLSDLPDHVAVQLEFAAWLFAVAAAREQGESVADTPISAAGFIAAFITRWAPLLRQDIEQTAARFELAETPWLHLARVLEVVAAIEAEPERSDAAAPEASEIERLRAQYAGRMPDASELAQLRAQLESQGLSGAHIEIPLETRDALDGLTTLSPPQPPRHTLPVG
jgi:putative dimethyl sulfoxide reductase chaperone